MVLIRFVFLAILSAAVHAQQPPARTSAAVRIAGFEVNGLSRLNAAQVIALTQLREGQVFDTAAMDSAIARLIATGVFANVACRYDAPRGGLVVFDIKEHDWIVPVIFDNFVWWTDDELIKAIAEVVPSFDGKAPQTDVVVKVMTGVLDRIVQEKKLGLHVEYLPGMLLGGRDNAVRQHRFQVKGVPLPVCALHFPQAHSVTEADLAGAARTLVGAEYRRQSLNGVVKDTVLPLYAQRGFIRARLVGPPEARYVTTAACRSGVDVTVAIEEGAQYRMGTFSVTGLGSGDAKKLTQAWKLAPGKVYDRSYAAAFMRLPAVLAIATAQRPRRLTVSESENVQRTTVDVEIVVK